MIVGNVIKHHSAFLTRYPATRLFPHRFPRSSVRTMSLSQFLSDSKQRYLKAIQEGKGREWTVVMGNEAGDLDSVASSIAFSWLASTVQKSQCVALLQTARNDLELRPENIYAFTLASLSSTREELLCIDDLPPVSCFPSNRFVLVDHNHLSPQYSDKNDDVKVVAVLDHHDDEGLYKDTADPRIIIVPTGSASSIVTRYIEQSTSQVLSEIARLLLCAIVVDTNGLKPGGKAEELDRAAAAYLCPRSELGTVSTFVSHEDDSAVSALARELMQKKFDITQLSTRDLLRRDYKQYAWTAKTRTLHVGLSTVPFDLRLWLTRGPIEDFWRDVDAVMDERNLDVLGILTSFLKEKLPKKRKNKDAERHKAKHRRQIMMIIREVPGENLEERLCGGLEKASELALERRLLVKFATKHHKKEHRSAVPTDAGVGNRIAHVYKQGNTKATRKIIAPLMKRIIEEETEVT